MTKTDDKPVSKQTLYQIASRHSRRAIERLVELMESKNENVAVGACKVLLNKTIPDLKREEIKQEAVVEYKNLSAEELNTRFKEIVEEWNSL